MTLEAVRPVDQATAPGALERAVRAEIVEAEDPERRVRRTMRRMRAWVAEHPRLEFAYRAGVGAVGTAMVVGGLILVPLPGPGWLIVFLGLAVMGTEFHWARRVAAWLKSLLDRFWVWWRARRTRKAAAKAAADQVRMSGGR
ncbi:TIGR02611 family protein [Microbacterium thalassium]|uniref:Uncharacterized protein (TIGR02611 family) n=1 Tax=Microbacterium thalassium TaxID=362649 RepID=A0A7X0FMB2_9MICO|nr:TIGR02611 family protein [Microbacterium thalassium]MBB6390096.1 uncharacterized protein (TIGR02611 family) [Microbacterium thalassium]